MSTIHIHRFIVNNKDCCGVTIVKLKDEWFYVCVHSMFGDFQFYRCDQFDGLISLINHINPRFSEGPVGDKIYPIDTKMVTISNRSELLSRFRLFRDD